MCVACVGCLFVVYKCVCVFCLWILCDVVCVVLVCVCFLVNVHVCVVCHKEPEFACLSSWFIV